MEYWNTVWLNAPAKYRIPANITLLYSTQSKKYNLYVNETVTQHYLFCFILTHRKTRKDSSRMPVAHLPTVHDWYWTMRFKFNKFEHVHGARALNEEGDRVRALYRMGQVSALYRGTLYSEDTPHVDIMTRRHDWNHYLPATSLADGN